MEIIFIHGFLHRPSNYQPLLDALASHAPTTAPHAPGHRSALGRPFRPVDWVESVASLVVERRHVVLIGHSAGGHVAARVAARRPSNVCAVVALETPLRIRRDLMSTDEAHAHVTTLAAEDPVMRDVVHFVAERDLDSFFKGFNEELLDSAIECPLLLVGADPAVGAMLDDAALSEARRRLDVVRTASVSGVGHMLGIDTGDIAGLLAVLSPFLEQIADG